MRTTDLALALMRKHRRRVETGTIYGNQRPVWKRLLTSLDTAHIVQISGESYRLTDKRKAGQLGTRASAKAAA
jgi:hypothetical protein